MAGHSLDPFMGGFDDIFIGEFLSDSSFPPTAKEIAEIIQFSEFKKMKQIQTAVDGMKGFFNGDTLTKDQIMALGGIMMDMKLQHNPDIHYIFISKQICANLVYLFDSIESIDFSGMDNQDILSFQSSFNNLILGGSSNDFVNRSFQIAWELYRLKKLLGLVDLPRFGMINEDRLLDKLRDKDDDVKKQIALDSILGIYQQVIEAIKGIYKIDIQRILSSTNENGEKIFTGNVKTLRRTIPYVDEKDRIEEPIPQINSGVSSFISKFDVSQKRPQSLQLV